MPDANTSTDWPVRFERYVRVVIITWTIVVVVSLASNLTIFESARSAALTLGHLALWAIGLGIILFGASRFRQQRQTHAAIETALRDSEATYRRLVEQSPASIVITDLKGDTEYVNPKFTAVTGYTSEEVLGKNPRILKSGEMTRDQYKVLWDTILAGNEWRGELHNKRKNGELYWEFASISPLKNAAGVTTHFLAVKEDITDRKRAEQAEHEQRILAEALRDTAADLNSTLQFDEVLDRILVNVERVVPHDAANIMLISGDTAYVCTSRGYAASFAHHDILTVRVPMSAPHLHQMMETGEPAILSDVSQYNSWLQRAESDWVRSYVSAPIRIKGETVGFLNLDSATPGFFNATHAARLAIFANQAATAVENARLYQQVQTELIERTRAEAALRSLQQQLQSANADLQVRNVELDAFAHTVAHDLKSTLNSIMGYAELLESDYETLPLDTLRASVHIIVRASHKMNNVIEELMLLSGVRNQAVTLQPLGMARIVEEAQQRLTYLLRESQAELIIPDQWPITLGYAPWIEEVWLNYISNAIKYGGRPPRIELGATPQPDGFVRWWVRDNGRGLSVEEQARLFTQFERLDQIRVTGHGLGLSIVKRIVEKLGGQVGVESAIGCGSTFSFTLPTA